MDHHQYIDTVDMTRPLSEWPRQIQTSFIKPHRGNLDRLNIILFLVHNGVHPEIAKKILIETDTGFDSEAKQHIKTLCNNFANIKSNVFDLHKQVFLNEHNRIIKKP